MTTLAPTKVASTRRPGKPKTVMGEHYWDRSAPGYETEVFDVLKHDRGGVVLGAVRRFASKRHEACDFGCGTGRALPALAEGFARVYGVDLSARLLEQARQRCDGLENVEVRKVDLADGRARLPQVHFGLSVNVAIMPSFRTRAAIFRTLARHLVRGGHLVLVVPSLESALYAHYRLIQMGLREGEAYDEAAAENAETLIGPEAFIPGGIVDLDGGPTKHYLREELATGFRPLGLAVLEVRKVEYPWSTEFLDVPKWMKAPYPWDWLAVLEKR